MFFSTFLHPFQYLIEGKLSFKKDQIILTICSEQNTNVDLQLRRIINTSLRKWFIMNPANIEQNVQCRTRRFHCNKCYTLSDTKWLPLPIAVLWRRTCKFYIIRKQPMTFHDFSYPCLVCVVGFVPLLLCLFIGYLYMRSRFNLICFTLSLSGTLCNYDCGCYS